MQLVQQHINVVVGSSKVLSKRQAWTVYQDGGLVDIVWFDANLSAFAVKQSLVHHDCYPFEIEVRKPS